MTAEQRDNEIMLYFLRAEQLNKEEQTIRKQVQDVHKRLRELLGRKRRISILRGTTEYIVAKAPDDCVALIKQPHPGFS